ncbi:hypothetical protein CT0861_08912 [Colletotrichum tofieldiae]|uniref:Uncharacterized protein n=1 Tax=Colletotrichum tofieldiae TaxID=708197 RepID=A0A166ZB01_9PEZI|nr:hypothetical protein CT0861_08912 [Colletotrichum tofieldiae]
MSGMIPALAKNMPSQWFASLGCVVAGSMEVFLWALCAACIAMLITAMYFHNRPKSPVYRPNGTAPLVQSEELTPGTTIRRKFFRYRKQGGLWNEYDLPEGSTLKINRVRPTIHLHLVLGAS